MGTQREASSSEPSDARFTVGIDVHGEQVIPWRQKQKSGTREDRMLSEVTVSLPPKISDYDPELPTPVAAQSDEALAAIARLDSAHGENLTALSVLLLRAESVASSKIEHVEASIEDFARAVHGTKSNASATLMVASAEALDALISSVEGKGRIVLSDVLAAHRILMHDDPREAPYAGHLRDVQNWIEGSDYSPRNATYVPPPAETVAEYMADLLEFANRDDVPVIAQAAIAHAQFESIHPFTDGNGRIGRALINTILRRRGVTSRVVVPIASALVAKKATYFEVLAAYREGDAGPMIRALARAARTASHESETTAERLAELPEQWNGMYVTMAGKMPRAGSAARKILDLLPTVPFFTSEDMDDLIGGATSSVYGAIEKLAEADVLRPLTNRKRKQVWCAGLIMDELEDLGQRIARRTSVDPLWLDIHSQVLEDLRKQNLTRQLKLTAAIARANRSESMQAAIDAARLSESNRAMLLASIRIPEWVHTNLDSLDPSALIREAIEAARTTDRAMLSFAQNTTHTEALLRSLQSWSKLSDSLVRTTRLPDPVNDALKVLLAQTATAGSEKDEREAGSINERAGEDATTDDGSDT
jgi:Fic family protein